MRRLAALWLLLGLAACGVEPDPVPVPSEPVAITRVVSANIGRGDPGAQCDAVRRVLDLAGPSGLVGWQEIGETDGACDEVSLLQDAGGSSVWTHTPTTYPDGAKSRAWSTRGTPGVDNVAPDRFVTAVRLRDRTTLLNTHMILHPDGRKWRREAWAAHWHLLMEIAAGERDRGRNVLITGDFNRRSLPWIPHGWVLAHRGVDWILAVPARDYRPVTLAAGSRSLGVDDHEALWVDLTWTRSPRPGR